MIHPRIAAAVGEVEVAFAAVAATEQPDGCVWLRVSGVDLGSGWAPRVVEVAVKLAPTFPDTMPYPWYLPAGLCRTDGVAVDRLSAVVLEGTNRTQLSLSGPWSPSDSLAARLHGVIHWLRSRGPKREAS